MLIAEKRDALFFRIKCISDRSKELQAIIDKDLIDFSESVGLDMSHIRNITNINYNADLLNK